jgi:hypothetical protein
VPAFLVGSRFPHLDVDVALGRAEHSMPGLPDPQLVARRLHRAEVVALIIGIVDSDQDVDDRLGGETGHPGGADLLDAPGEIAQ